MKRLSRRTVLRGLGGIAIGLPLLDAMEARAQTTPVKRFVAMFTPNGTVKDQWVPTGSETSFTLSPILSPLEAFKSKLVVLADLDNVAAINSPGFPHPKGMGTLLTGTEVVFQQNANAPTGGGISIDQRMAQVLGTTTRFPHFGFGVQAKGTDVWSRLSYSGAALPIPPQSDPWAAFTTLFTGLETDPTAAARIRDRKKSVLDTVLNDFKRLNATVGVDDRRRLDAHAAEIRNLETRLANVPMQSPDCRAPVVPEGIDPKDNHNYALVGQLQMDLLAMSLQCDLLRVATFEWSGAASNVVFDWLDINTMHHELSHRPDDDAQAAADLTRIHTWYAEQFAYLLGKLDSVQDGDGTLLDHSLILWGNELGKGNDHSLSSVPFVLAGKAAGALNTGRFLQTNHAAHNDLLLSCLHMMDVPDASFGNPAITTGPLLGL